MSALIIATSILCFAAVLVFRYYDRAIGARKLPYKSPPGLPVIGNTVELVRHRHDINSFILDYTRKFGGEPWYVTMPLTVTIYVNDYENIEFILKNPDIFQKGNYMYSKLRQILGDGIFNADGDKWRFQRKIISSIFTHTNFTDIFVPAFSSGLLMLDKILEKFADTGNPVDMLEVFGKFTLDTFTFVFFGRIPCEEYEVKDRETFASSFADVQLIADQRFRLPFWGAYEAITGASKIMAKAVSVMDEFTYGMLNERFKDMKSGSYKPRNDLLDKLLSVKDSKGKSLTNTQLRDITINLLFAGRDTTSQTLSWLFFLLTKDKRGPAFVEKMIEEFDYVAPDGIITYEKARNDLYVFQALFYEATRLFPAIPKNLKCASEDTLLPNGSILVRKGERVVFSLFTSSRLASNWGPRACEYLPERWLNNINDILAAPIPVIHASGDCPRIMSVKDRRYHSFNSGPRRCLGADFAIVEAAVIMGHLLRKYRFELDKSDYGYDYKADDLSDMRLPSGDCLNCESITIPKKYGVRLKVHYRDKDFVSW